MEVSMGESSISMGHQQTMAMLVITRGYMENTGWCPPVMFVGLDSPHENYSYICHKP